MGNYGDYVFPLAVIRVSSIIVNVFASKPEGFTLIEYPSESICDRTTKRHAGQWSRFYAGDAHELAEFCDQFISTGFY